MSNVIHDQAELFDKIAAGQAAPQQAKDALSYTQSKHSSVLQSTTAASFDGRRKLSSSFGAKDRTSSPASLADSKIDQHYNDVGECCRNCVRAKKCTERIMRDVLLLLDSAMLQGQQVSHHEISNLRDKVVSEVLAMTESQEQRICNADGVDYVDAIHAERRSMNSRTLPPLFLNNPFTSSTVPTTGREITRALQSGVTTITQAGSALSGVNSQMPPLVNDKALPRAESAGSTDPYEYIDKLYAIAGMSSYVKANSTTNTSSYYGSSVYSSTRTMRDSVSEASGSRNPPSLHVVTGHQSSLQDPEFQQSLIEMVTGKHQQQHIVQSENNGLQEAVGGGEEGQCQSMRADENRSPVQQLHQCPGGQEENIMKLRPTSSTFRTAPSASLLKRVASRGLISRKVSFAESDNSNNGSDIRLLTVLMNNNRSPAGEGGHLVPPLSAAPSHSFSLILPHQQQTLHGTVVKRASRSRLETVSRKQYDDNEVHHEQEHAGEDDYSVVADEEPNNFNRRAAGHPAEMCLRPAGRRDGARDRRLSTIASMESTPSTRRSLLYASDGSEFEALMVQNLSESDRQQGLANTPNDPGLAYRSRWRTGTCHDVMRPKLLAPDAVMDHQQRTATRTVRTAGPEQLNASFENASAMTPPIISSEAPNMIVKQNDNVMIGFLGIESGSSDEQPGRDRKSHSCNSTKHSFWTKLKHRLNCLVTCSIHGDSTTYTEDTDDDKREGASHITVTIGVNESSCHQDGKDDTALQPYRPLSHHSSHHRDVISITPQQSVAANDGTCCPAVNDRSLSHHKASSDPVALSSIAFVPPGSCQHHPYDGGDVDCPQVILAAPVTAEKLHAALACIQDWSYDSFTLAEASQGRPLSTLGFALLKQAGIISCLQIQETKLSSFLQAIEDGYRDNPYHNRIHAADVLRNIHVIATRGGLLQMLAPKNNMKGMQLHNQKSMRAQERTGHVDLCPNEKPSFQIARKEALLLLGVYLSAIVHDYDHRGVTNAFLVQDEDLLALTYNDLSPMENHHVSAAFLLMKKNPNNFLECLPRLERDQLRDQVVQMVLGTDMKQHFSTCSIFTSKIVTKCIATAAPVLQLVDESTRNVCASGQDVFRLRQNSTSRPRRAFSELRQVRLSQSCRVRSLDPHLSVSLSDCQPLTGRNVPATENQHLNMRPALTSQPTLLINSNRAGPDGPQPAPATIEHHLPTLHRLSNIPSDEAGEQRDVLEHLCHAVETPLLNHASPTDSSIEPNTISLSSSSPALTSAVNSTAAALDVQHKPFSTTSVTDEETVHQASSNLKTPFCEADRSVEARPASLPGVVLHSQPTINRSSATLTKEKMKSSSGSDREGSSVMAAGTQQAALDLDDEDAMLLWKVALKCADLGHLASKEAVHVRWVHLLEEEMFRQGDLERERGYPVSPLMDRTKAGITNSQPGFFNIIVLPLFASFTEALPSVKPLLDQVRKNYDMWSSASGPSTS